MLLTIKEGEIVSYKTHKYCVKSPVSLSKVLLVDDAGGTIIAPIHELSVVESGIREPLKNGDGNDLNSPIEANNFMEVPEKIWEKIKNREQHLKELLKSKPSVEHVNTVAKNLNISSRQVYNLMKKYKKSGYSISGLIIKKRLCGKDKSRLLPEIEAITKDTINELYCHKQRLKASVVIEEIRKRCVTAGFKPPSQATVRKRIQKIPQQTIIATREGAAAARRFDPIISEGPETYYPLQRVQVDHTIVDLVVVDEKHRKPIGRPYLTVAIDLYSRCIAGFYLSLDAPCATSVGLCLVHAIFSKEGWLSNLKVDGDWPIFGKPDLIYVDNAAEFHGEALTRGCEFHGIKVEYRPLGTPHYGGIVERVIGTLMQLVHQIPGTTFSNIMEKGDYDSEVAASLTLRELERWLTIAIVNYYHQKLHSTLLMPPIEKYRIGILGEVGQKGRGYPTVVVNKQAFLIDFLPIERRILRRQGFVIDHIVYYSNILTSFIRKKGGTEFIIRRDPRDLSKIYMLDSESNSYLEIPYRNLARPTITLWEHKAALKQLRQYGKNKVDEALIFKAIEELNELVKEAALKSKKIRRNQERKTLIPVYSSEVPKIKKGGLAIDLADEPEKIKPFEVELW